MLLTRHVNGVEISYDASGTASGPALVLLTGWTHDHRLYDELLPFLAPKYWVIRINWRGHGPCRDDLPNFGIDEQITDTIALLDALEVDQFYLAAHSHGVWAALGIVDQLTQSSQAPARVLCLLMIDQIMTPPPPAFAAGLALMQNHDTWKQARQGLYDDWAAGSENRALRDHFLYSFGGFGRKMWMLSSRVIAGAYERYGSPMKRMEMIQRPPPIRHVFSHPLGRPEYRMLHEEFAREHPWFSFRDLEGQTHFPSLEIPERLAGEIDGFIKSVS